MNPILWSMAIAPALAIAAYFYIKDKYHREPLKVVITVFVWGMLSVIPVLILLSLFGNFGLDPATSAQSTAIVSFGLIAVREELAKFLVLRFVAFKQPAFDEPFDGIVYGVMTSLGFATVENIMYVVGADSFASGMQIGVMRMFTAVPMHAFLGAIMGYYAGKAKFASSNNRSQLIKRGVMLAILMHGAYDFFLLQQNWPGLAFVAFIVLVIAARLSNNAVKELSAKSPFKPK